MRLTIHNVGHGSCISLVHDNGNTMLWDCGHEEAERPSSFLPSIGVRKIDYFFVTNYDEDHISDLPNLRQNLNVRAMYRNKSISEVQLRNLKRQGGPISPAMESMLEMIKSYTAAPPAPAPDFPGVSFCNFSNPYGGDFQDTNNISQVTFIRCGGKKFLFPGDLEAQGWQGLLKNQAFRAELSSVNVFVASHHGRENGYCEDVFDYCSPDVFVFSDSNVKHATQETAQKYAQHADGIPFNGSTRCVLTTRNDGSLTWNL
jgi:beta-lactamase superfamily II metal-dependent hydrolase